MSIDYDRIETADMVFAPPPPRGTFAPVTAAELIVQYPALRPPVIEGLIRQGEVMNIVSAPKIGKSWLVHGLAMATAAGDPWLGMPTTRGKVLLIDAELHEETLAKRLGAISHGIGTDPRTMHEIDVWPVRGKRITVDELPELLKGVKPGAYRIIVIDPLYRFAVQGRQENDNTAMEQTYTGLDKLAGKLRTALIVVHHSSKGNQSERSVTDVGSGAGAMSRAADCHLVLRPHEEEGAVVVEAAVRSWKPLQPFVIAWADPGWQLAPHLDPAALRQSNARRSKPKDTDPAPAKVIWTPEKFASEIVGTGLSIKAEVIARAKVAGMSGVAASEMLDRALAAELVRRVVATPSSPHKFTASEESGPTGGGAG